MSSTFAKPVDSFRTTTVANRLVGGSEMGVAKSPIVGALPANRVFRLTAVLNPDTDNEQILTVLEADNFSSGMLIGVRVSEGYNDVLIPSNTTIDIRVCARDIIELQDAINAAENTLAAHQVVINNIGSGGGGGGIPGGSPNSLQYNNGSGGFAGNEFLTWDESTSSLTVPGTIFASFNGDGSNIDNVHLRSSETSIVEGTNYLIFYQDNDTLSQEPDFRYNPYETNLIVGGDSHQGRITISSDDTVGNRGLVLSNRTNHIDIYLQALMPDGFVVHDGSGIPASTSVGPLKVTLGYYQSIGITVTLVDQQDADAFQVLAADKTTKLMSIDKTGTFVCPTIISAANDGAAEAAGVPLYGFYQNGGNVRVRLT